MRIRTKTNTMAKQTEEVITKLAINLLPAIIQARGIPNAEGPEELKSHYEACIAEAKSAARLFFTEPSASESVEPGE